VGALLSDVTDGGFQMQACSWTYGGIGFIILPEAGSDGVTSEWEACALRHETAHINGWPPSHPNAHYEGATLIDTIFR
jgi:hypothetical protein